MTTALVSGLEQGTNYSFYIRANYSTGHKPASSIFTYKTLGYGADNRKCVDLELLSH